MVMNRNLKIETESLIIGTQNAAIRTNYIKAKIDNSQVNSNCRLCGKRGRIVNHMLSECSNPTQKECKNRHNWGCKGSSLGIMQETDISFYSQMV